MNYYIFIPVISLIVNLFLWGMLFGQKNKSLVNLSYLLFSFFVSIWLVSTIITWLPFSEATLNISLRVFSFSWISIGLLFLNFSYFYVNKKKDGLFFTMAGLCVLSYLLCILTNTVVTGVEAFPWGHRPLKGLLFLPVAFVVVLAPFLYSMFLIFKKYKSDLKENERKVSLTILAGTGLAIVIGFTTDVIFPEVLKINDLIDLGSSTSFIQSTFIFYSVMRYDLMKISPETFADELFNQVPEAVIVLDNYQNIIRHNNRALEIFNKANNEIDGKNIVELIPDYRKNFDYINDPETVLVNGKQKRILISKSAIAELSNNNAQLLVIRDVTKLNKIQADKEKLESELLQSQKMDSLGRMVSSLTHDFNNTLNSMVNYAQLTKKNINGAQEKNLKFLDNILRSGEVASHLIKKLLAFSRKNKIENTVIKLNTLIFDMTPLLGQALTNQIKIEMDLSTSLPDLMGDNQQIQSAILNMAINAKDAMDSGGVFSILTKKVSIDEYCVEAKAFSAKPGNYVQLDLMDNGCGMDEGIRRQIFDPFFTTKGEGKGTGLGLGSVYGAVKSHDGFLKVVSEVSGGTTFSLYFPAVESIGESKDIADKNNKEKINA